MAGAFDLFFKATGLKKIFDEVIAFLNQLSRESMYKPIVSGCTASAKEFCQTGFPDVGAGTSIYIGMEIPSSQSSAVC